jgi:hypothetical protein
MDERIRIATQLRAIAAQIENDMTDDEREVKEHLLNEAKKGFYKLFKSDPANKGRNVDEVWKALEKAITLDVKRIYCASSLNEQTD